jgi:hypothetical protein
MIRAVAFFAWKTVGAQQLSVVALECTKEAAVDLARVSSPCGGAHTQHLFIFFQETLVKFELGCIVCSRAEQFIACGVKGGEVQRGAARRGKLPRRRRFSRSAHNGAAL